ncbi:hypothetical protein PBI_MALAGASYROSE_50 [Mycobacterium phage MalagasyRose]|uniref:Uncharacterized protein n=1 Tax=Mycobacterium phage MalagasyRose TaxID=2599870 RepID=A0A5J6TEP7_9CAUD|nr:hypothetical protein QEH39_gp38 [Mycobacterium phage MalagasyRose]QFG08898.1 hypothetical protein PBI_MALAGASYROSE_50 [Mycobacterium phage MalagasyRose]
MSAPYCVLCNRPHEPGEQHPGDHPLAILGWALLLVFSVVVALAVAALSVGISFGGLL